MEKRRATIERPNIPFFTNQIKDLKLRTRRIASRVRSLVEQQPNPTACLCPPHENHGVLDHLFYCPSRPNPQVTG